MKNKTQKFTNIDQVLDFMLKIQNSQNGTKPERPRIPPRFESDALRFTKNGLRMLPEMSSIHLHKQEKNG